MTSNLQINQRLRKPKACDKPALPDLQHMEYTDDNRQIVHFRLMDQVKPSWKRLAVGLKFLQHRIATIEEKDDPVYFLLSEWLQGANQEIDLRPITWESLIASLRDANLQLEADTLENHLIQIETASSAVSRVGQYAPSSRPKITQHTVEGQSNTKVRNLSDVKEWINQFSTLKVIKWEEVEAAKPPHGELYKRFMAKKWRLPHSQRKLHLAFHGTKARFIRNICQNGYDSPPTFPWKFTKKQRRGRKAKKDKKVTFFSTNPDSAKKYCCDEHKMIVNELLFHGKDGVDSFLTKDQSVIGLSNPYCCALPRFIITYE